MTFKTLDEQREAANEQLLRLGSPLRLRFTTSHHRQRIIVSAGKPTDSDVKVGESQILMGATVNQTSDFLSGFNAALLLYNTFNLPVNKNL